MKKKRPNVLLITTDQQHWNTIKALGNPFIETPNLDRLAANGVAFTRAYTANPVCSPSRSSILTGEYPSRHGCWNIGVELGEQTATLGNILSADGYSTALFGKAHLKPVLDPSSFEGSPHIYDRAFWKNWNGPYYGFDYVEMVHGHADEDSSHGMHYGVWLEGQGIDTGKFFGPGGGHREGEWDLPEQYHYTRWTADRTIEYFERNCATGGRDDAKPFFAWCSFQDPHNAFLCPGDWPVKYDESKLPGFHEQEGEMEDKPLLHRLVSTGRMQDLGIEIMKDPGHPTDGIQCLGTTTGKVGRKRAREWLSTYYSMISLIDHHIGRIIAKLEQLEILDNTILIFTSDHGEYLGNHGLWLKGPIHYEDVIRVPFVVHCPALFPSGRATESLLSLVDLAPTILSLCNAPIPLQMQGINQSATWINPDIESRNWCLVENRAEPTFYVKTLVTDRFKLNYFLDREEGELYDLIADPYEFINLYDNPRFAATKISLLTKMIDAYGSMENLYRERKSFA